MSQSPQSSSLRPSFADALRFWTKLGFISFGGPSGQIAIMHSELVERKRWVSEDRFLHALNYCMLLPGPEAQQLAIYMGWLLHGTRGGIVAGVLFVVPSALILWALSWAYIQYGDHLWMTGLFEGLKPAVLAIVLGAVVKIGKRALKTPFMWVVAGMACIALSLFHIPFPLVLGAAALMGGLGQKLLPSAFPLPTQNPPHARPSEPITELDRNTEAGNQGWTRVLRVAITCLVLWWTPVILAGLLLGPDHVLVRMGVFFSKAAMVTFGGAYAVLPYVSQQAVEIHGWVSPGQMLDGLGLAETTPGPLIMVLQFVGFLGGWKLHHPLSPLVTATLAALMTTWTTFVPSFMWIFLGAPSIERFRNHVRLNAALTTLTAAVVGVMLNLAVWLGWHVLFPEGKPANLFGMGICVSALVAVTRFKWGVIPVVIAAGIAGLIRSLWMAS